MPTNITLRRNKSQPLTFDEVDDNFENLKATADAAATGSGLAALTAEVATIDSELTTLTGRVDTIEGDYTTAAQAGVIADAAVVEHVALPDPHTQYLTDAESVSYAPTKAAADSLAAGLGDGATVIVDRDETNGNLRTRYTVSSSALTGKITIGTRGWSIPTIAALKTIIGSVDGDSAFVTSYYDGWEATVSGPEGGGRFVWDAASTATDDGGTIFAVDTVTTGRWRRIPEAEHLNVKWFGVRGDGVTDDTPTLQSALFRGNSNPNSATFDAFFFPNGVYRVTNLKIPSHVRLVGETKFNSIIKTLNAAQTGVMLEDNGDAQKISLLNLTIQAYDGPFSAKAYANYSSILRLGFNSIQWGTEATLQDVIINGNPGSTCFDINGNVGYIKNCLAFEGDIGLRLLGTTNRVDIFVANDPTLYGIRDQAFGTHYYALEVESALSGAIPFSCTNLQTKVFGITVSGGARAVGTNYPTIFEFTSPSADSVELYGIVYVPLNTTRSTFITINGQNIDQVVSEFSAGGSGKDIVVKINEAAAAAMSNREFRIKSTTPALRLTYDSDLLEDVSVALEGAPPALSGRRFVICNTSNLQTAVNFRALHTANILANGNTVVIPSTGFPIRFNGYLDVRHNDQSAVFGIYSGHTYANNSNVDWPSYPQTGFWNRGETVRIDGVWTQFSNDYLKICTTPGYATKGGWVTSTAYYQGVQVSNEGRIYRAMSAGTSGATPPIHTSGTESDGGVLWKFIATSSASPVFKKLVMTT